MTNSDHTGRVTLAFDDLFCNATLDELAAIRALTPVHLLDQFDAATDDVRKSMRRFATQKDTADLVEVDAKDHPAWVRLGLFNALVTWQAGKGSTCVHSPDPRKPQPVHSAAWRPGLMVCDYCSHLLALPRGSIADRRCDDCGRVTGGPENDDCIYSCVVSFGPLTYSFGACSDCRYWQPDQLEEAS